ncbi:MAG: CHAT domain-containing tetratricopeptide repeat protein [Cyanobacteria bacterium J06600_6]
MDYKKLLIKLLESDFGQGKKLLAEYQSSVDRNFAITLENVAESAKNDYQYQWAKIQYLLGLVVYYHFEDSTANLEKAIAYLKESQEIFSRDKFSLEWATCENYLGNFIRRRENCKSPEQIKNAIAHYKNALEIRQQDSHLEEWRSTQYNLGITYGMLADVVAPEQKLSCLSLAKNCLENFLCFTTSDEEEQWAETKIAIGALAQEIALKNGLSNLHYALECYKDAEKVAKAKDQIEIVALACDYQGHVYRELSRHENHQENLEQAYLAYQKALEKYDRDTQAYNWAATHNDLGLVLIEKEQEQEAIASFEQALTVFKPKTFPFECTRSARNLGNLAYQNHRWKQAISGYDLAVEAVESIISKTNSDSQRQAFLEENSDVYSRLVESCVATGEESNLAKAIETVERSRSGYLVNLTITDKFFKEGNITEEFKKKIEERERIQKEIDDLRFKYQKKAKSGEKNFRSWEILDQDRDLNFSEDVHKLEALVIKQDKVWQELNTLDSDLARQLKVEPFKCDRIQQLIDSPQKAIVSFYSAFENTYIFVLRQSGISSHCCPNLSLEKLNQWLRQTWFEPYQNEEDSNKQSWIASMEPTLKKLALKLDLDGLVRDCLQDLTDLIIIPHQLLHLMPFAALPLAGDKYLGDLFTIQVSPNCQILEFLQGREQPKYPFSYGTVIHSQSGLPSSLDEEKLIAGLYNIPENLRIKGKAATKENYYDLLFKEQVQGILSSHHAKFYPDKPLDSELILNDSTIQLRELLAIKWNAEKINLEEVFLNCCETNFGTTTNTDDLITIAAGFLCAGAKNVVSSLWVVEDSSGALLSFFYHQERLKGLSSPRALQKAQIRLRNLSDRDLIAAEKEKKLAIKRRGKPHKSKDLREQERYKKEYYFYWKVWELTKKVLELKRSQPLSHPFYWAVFTSMGIA